MGPGWTSARAGPRLVLWSLRGPPASPSPPSVRQVSPHHREEDGALSCGPSSTGETEPDSSKDEEVRPRPGQVAAQEAGDERGWGVCVCVSVCVCGLQPEGGL